MNIGIYRKKIKNIENKKNKFKWVIVSPLFLICYLLNIVSFVLSMISKGLSELSRRFDGFLEDYLD
jgi:hypothetical protein